MTSYATAVTVMDVRFGPTSKRKAVNTFYSSRIQRAVFAMDGIQQGEPYHGLGRPVQLLSGQDFLLKGKRINEASRALMDML
mmetsp:Transcript_3808/g.5389  ORF Transcript_3808/g.5389 Transcript_3808/m.5389 type:complete len:82 (+) Transcript_3808:305-550(+)|eukprot:CAMPEP_0184755098 /NCGR_PEP_ID=MMETSP0315-20130426/44977_1 /TAXON_ID=101924 /ORGANISM="Rhodosorus marinus, Strain UTEX LB 2760" /LENGTH=81 /DNA_ID=CAMNT_0027234565 /DNA_START=265 /DNA_END=510 /DNA_ORIENTATION=+